MLWNFITLYQTRNTRLRPTYAYICYLNLGGSHTLLYDCVQQTCTDIYSCAGLSYQMRYLHLSSAKSDVLEAIIRLTQNNGTSTHIRPPAYDVTAAPCFIHRLRSVSAVSKRTFTLPFVMWYITFTFIDLKFSTFQRWWGPCEQDTDIVFSTWCIST